MNDFYNDSDPKAAAWLRELVKQGHLPKGEVDERGIQELTGGDLAGYRQVHLFAGIGGAERCGISGRLADSDGGDAGDGGVQRGREHGQWAEDGGTGERLGDTDGIGRERIRRAEQEASSERFWADAILIPCRDGKTRRVKPGIFPLAHGLPGRVGLLRGAGNAIVPQVAAAFVQAFLQAEQESEV